MKIKTGEELRIWRKRNNLTQEEVASKIGYTKETLCRYEKNNKTFPKDKQEEINNLKQERGNDDFISSWNSIKAKSIYNLYKDEFNELADNLSRLLIIPKDPLLAGPYLDYLNTAFESILSISNINTPITDEETIKILLKDNLSFIKSKAKLYLDKKSLPT